MADLKNAVRQNQFEIRTASPFFYQVNRRRNLFLFRSIQKIRKTSHMFLLNLYGNTKLFSNTYYPYSCAPVEKCKHTFYLFCTNCCKFSRIFFKNSIQVELGYFNIPKIGHFCSSKAWYQFLIVQNSAQTFNYNVIWIRFWFRMFVWISALK